MSVGSGYHLARDCNLLTFYSQTIRSTSNKTHVLALYAVQNYCVFLLIINWKSVFSWIKYCKILSFILYISIDANQRLN
jgi:hypothetical protein